MRRLAEELAATTEDEGAFGFPSAASGAAEAGRGRQRVARLRAARRAAQAIIDRRLGFVPGPETHLLEIAGLFYRSAAAGVAT